MRLAGIPLLFMIACSGSDDAAKTEPTATSEGFLGQLCDLDQGCCTTAKKTYDGVACRSSLAALGTERRYDAVAGKTCIAALKASGTAFCDTGSNIPECKSVFVSTAVDAGAQTGDGGSHGKQGDSCGATRRKNGIVEETAGASPGAVTCWNDDNLFCDSGAKICKPRAGAGAPCQTASSLDCAPGTQCDVPMDGEGNMQCIALQPEGSGCVENSRYAEESCAEGLDCNDGTCIAFGTGNVVSGASDVSAVACK